jgi:hypothetical protein
MKFGFRTIGREHTVGERSCSGCAGIKDGGYPRPHKEYDGVSRLGFIHAEEFEEPAKTVYMCDACNANPRPDPRSVELARLIGMWDFDPLTRTTFGDGSTGTGISKETPSLAMAQSAHVPQVRPAVPVEK